MTPDFLLHMVAIGAGAAGVYAAIRGDLVAARMRAEQACESVKDAHKRLDDHIDDHLTSLTKR